ncbi:MAG TPA: GyrI-like domain-containing protein [Thermoplasmata archaeon]|nr:GyrI-like domain-containing protein [Thermoplasmata archaeon]
MTVDFELKKSPAMKVACLAYRGPYKENMLQKEFRQLTQWAKDGKVRTGHWIFSWKGDKRSDACLEIKGTRFPPRPEGVRLATLPATWVARVAFDPEELSPRVVYHGLSDWTRERKKDKTIRAVGSAREVYAGDPWSNKAAWAHCTVEYLVRK